LCTASRTTGMKFNYTPIHAGRCLNIRTGGSARAASVAFFDRSSSRSRADVSGSALIAATGAMPLPSRQLLRSPRRSSDSFVIRRISATVSSEEVARGKPAPDVYLEAARRLAVEPERCAAVACSLLKRFKRPSPSVSYSCAV